jgi:AmmeMemoRadiSam system protein B
MWLLRDPWELSEQRLVVPHALAPLLHFCDGTRTIESIREEFSAYAGEDVPAEIVHDAIDALDAAFLLENARSQAMIQSALAQYRTQPFRPPALANRSYPQRPGDLNALFQGFGFSNGSTPQANRLFRGIISPHIDYPRGGTVYAQVWQRAIPSILAADLVIILGTDHNGRPGSITLTQLPYATPFGLLPSDPALVQALAAAVGEENAFAEELNHRGEHSIELSAVWLHYVYDQFGKKPPPMVPVLIGSFHHHIVNDSHPSQDPALSRFLNVLQGEIAGRQALIVASVDLAHVGPNFGDPFDMDAERRARLTAEDNALMEIIAQGNAASFYGRIASIEDRNRICGFSPLYVMLRILGETDGIKVAYQHCPADTANTSLVSICGLLLQ